MSKHVDEALRYGTALVGRHEALLLLTHMTDKTQTELLLHGDDMLPCFIMTAYEALLAERKKQRPLQYIIGCWPFMGLTLTVDARALIPRPETEQLVEAVIQHLRDKAYPSPPRVLDMCAGGGCIGIALAYHTGARVTAVDSSLDALSLAKENAVTNGVQKNMVFVQSDLFNELDEGEVFDVIVSNPPYIPTGDIPLLDAGVREYEPYAALDGGIDGLDIYRRLIPQSVRFLSPGGALFLEIGPAEGVATLLRQAGYVNIKTLRDLAGLDRIVTGIKQ